MPEKSEKSFPSWDSLYKSQKVQTMPWYNENLDTDLEEELERRKITKGRILESWYRSCNTSNTTF